MRGHLTLVALIIAATIGCDKTGKTDSVPAAPAKVQPGAAATTAPVSGRRNGVGSLVYVVERETESMAIYDLMSRELLPQRIEGFGNMRHAVMAFSPDLRYGYVATRSGKLSRIDLETMTKDLDVEVSQNSIDIAISQDGRYLATAEYVPGGLTVLDARSLSLIGRLSAQEVTGSPSRVTGVVDAPGNKLVCVLIEGAEVWIVALTSGQPVIEHRIKTSHDEPYDAMITPDGRYYLVGHMGSEFVSVVDLRHPEQGVREITIRDPGIASQRGVPVKLPHMASWAVAGDSVFVPLVGENRLAVLDRATWKFKRSIELRGHPVYAVASPTQAEVWVSFSGKENDAWIEVIDAEAMTVKKAFEVGERIYHLDFTPRGSHVLVSANVANKLALVDASTYEIIDEETIQSPSGVFGAWRAYKIGL